MARKKLSRKKFLSGLKPKTRSSKISRSARLKKLKQAQKKRLFNAQVSIGSLESAIDRGFSKRVTIGGVPAQLRLIGRTKTKGYKFAVFTPSGRPLNKTITVPKGAGLK